MFSETMLISTKLINGLGLTIVGMGVVFTALILVSVALDVLKLVSAGVHKKRIDKRQEIKIDPDTQVELPAGAIATFRIVDPQEEMRYECRWKWTDED